MHGMLLAVGSSEGEITLWSKKPQVGTGRPNSLVCGLKGNGKIGFADSVQATFHIQVSIPRIQI